MAQGDPTSSGYAAGTPDSFLGARRSSRVTGGAAPIEVQEITHGHLGPISGRKALTTAGTREALVGSTTLARKVMVQYGEGSSGIICIGGAGVVAALATRNGFALMGVGDWIELDISDLALVYMDSTVSGDFVAFNYWTL